MKFGNLNAAYLLWVVIGLGLFYLWAFKKREKEMEGFAQSELLAQLTLNFDKKKQKIKTAIILSAVFLCVFSLMQPRWGFYWHKLKRKGLDILIAVDVSKSMLATDIRPNRLERSKLAIKDLTRKIKGDRIGLIAFAGKAFLQCPLTIDYNGFLLSLDNLSVGIIPRPGTSITAAINEAIKSYKDISKEYKVLVIITDGEDHEGDAIKATEGAKKEGIKIFCIGIGTKEGELIPIVDEAGKKTFLKNREGNFVKSRLNELLLQKIALSTEGSYVRARGAEFGLDLIYEQELSKMERRDIEGKMAKKYKERFQIPLALAFLLLLVEPFLIPLRKKSE
ncbi:MAG: VWA domain-containing protein [Candidatus Omnitrophota bacterium]|nr:MAG: VWA domain-containing protein [Candidatus Omnitrophota bacterium]